VRITTKKAVEKVKETISSHLEEVIPPGTMFVDAWDETVLMLGKPAIRLRVSKGGVALAVTAIWDVLHAKDSKRWQCVVDYRIRQRSTLTMDLIDLLLGQKDPIHLLPHVRQAIYLDEIPTRYRRKPVVSLPINGVKG
jgi:hypothetical protein